MAYGTDRIEHLRAEGVRDKVYPGALWAVGTSAGIHASGASGVLAPDESDTRMWPDTVLYSSRDRQPPTAVRNAFRELVFS